MKSNYRINSWMKKILIELDGKALTRRALIERAALIPKYAGPKQAEMFVSRNVFALNQNGLLLSKGRLKQRTYVLTSELDELLNIEVLNVIQEDFNILVSEKQKVTDELNILLSEIETYQELFQRLPSKKLLIESFLEIGKERSIVLNGKLKAINKILE